MEYSHIHTLKKLGTDQYFLWKLHLSRERLYMLRQQERTEYEDLRSLFAGMPSAGIEEDERMNFILPDHHGKLSVVTDDMGADFYRMNQFNGESMTGTREEIMAKLRESLQKQGCHFRSNACFQNADVLKTLQKIMEHNTDFYQTDFSYDRKKLSEAAEDPEESGCFFWLSRKNGTWCFPEKSVYINRTSQHNTWFYYGGCPDEHVKAFWIQLHGRKDGMVMGDILEIDYQSHLDYLCTHSHEPAGVEIVFKESGNCRTFSCQEYDQNVSSIEQRYGAVEKVSYLAEDVHELSCDIAKGHEMFREAAERIEVDEYIARLDHDRLHDYGYTAGDLVLTGPLDIERAVRHGLECYLLNKDGTREPVCNRETYNQALFHGKLFGMTVGEREFLQYLKQDTIPLFTSEEMQKIYELTLQAGMENGAEERDLLDHIIHKAECILSQEGPVNRETKGILQEEMIR